ncbi:D-glycero-alpha-D-manno-heptose-1,7-bisphosphate 7-phosphatase [Actinoalloteichus hymeniacidonis]|uniref:D,D-heptose 1,7-bisphosphate phosphatase n=1 Tax=Actinoalloteichus hymeniacidonis TaxID=340345 RepID=A0AAC9HPJ7_9PSEU|nr:HAD family hydrolase [Actinoalloteichus hymeniacidonis]AOS63024.1 histidinol-phosphate phosphatase family protein [Actinoalloteichus hymeniacidonis]MBB5908941.1 HAD superfamily hydrolase (TIGR01662 family) [Actinoalloteichus hymeniacidonis]
MKGTSVAATGRPTGRVSAVLFDRDGTLIEEVPYNGDPSRVRPVPSARRALERLRALGIPVGVITNQSGLGRGLMAPEQVKAVNRIVEAQLGRFDVWAVCPHQPTDHGGCACRKPKPGMVLSCASRLGVPVSEIVVIGDTGSDMQAALAAGATPILVPSPMTLPVEIEQAPLVADDLDLAVHLALGLALPRVIVEDALPGPRTPEPGRRPTGRLH